MLPMDYLLKVWTLDNRLFCVLGDVAATVLTGAVVGWLSWLIVDTDWNMFIAMLILMPIGMFVALLMWIPASMLLVAMECMIPMMLAGMVSAMFVGMWLAMSPLGAEVAFMLGAVFGLLAMVVVWILNNSARGSQPVA